MHDLKYALRTLRKSPGFTIVSLLTLALGIGVNSSMFSLMNTLLFATAPFPRPESIVALYGQTPEVAFITLSASRSMPTADAACRSRTATPRPADWRSAGA